MKTHDLTVYQVPSTDLTEHPENVNVGNMPKITESIEHNGMYQPILVQAGTGYVIAGNHRFRALTQMGETLIPAIMLDVDDMEAKRIMLADNRTTRLGHDDPVELAELLSQIYETNEGLVGTGYDTDDLQELMDAIEKPYMPPIPSDPDFGDGPGLSGIEYTLEAIPTGDGACYEFVLRRGNNHPMSTEDLNKVRQRLGMERASRTEIADYDIADWNS